MQVCVVARCLGKARLPIGCWLLQSAACSPQQTGDVDREREREGEKCSERERERHTSEILKERCSRKGRDIYML